MIYCKGCGKEIHETANVCPHCGARQSGVGQSSGGPKSKIVAFVLAWFLGWIGVHHFYLGNTGKGILYLLFFWTGIPCIVGVVEGIVYLSTNDNKWNQQYGE